MKYKYKLLAEEILEEYVNAYSEVDLDRVAKKIEEVAKDTAKEILTELVKRAEKISFFDCRMGLDLDELAKKHGVEVE